MHTLDLLLGTSLALFAATDPASAGTVHVVDPTGSGDFTTLQEAADAALEGDTLLVVSGAYGGLGIHGKGLTVVADAGAQVTLSHEIAVRFVPASSRVTLIGLEVDATDRNRGMVLSDNAGPVWIEDCHLRGSNFPANPGWYDNCGEDGLFLTNCDEVVIVRCWIVGGIGCSLLDPLTGPYPGPGGDGIHAEGSSLTIYGGQSEGGHGGSCISTDAVSGADGGEGLRLESGSFAFVSGSTFIGGQGGDGGSDGWDCGSGGNGGCGIHLDWLGTCTVAHQDCTLLPGPGGQAPPGWSGSCSDGLNGSDIRASHGTVIPVAGIERELKIQTPGREGDRLPLTAVGAPGDLVLRFASSSLDPLWTAPLGGVRLLAIPHPVAFVGRIGASGVLTRRVTAPGLPASIEAKTTYLQGFFRDRGGVWHLGSGGALVVLDSSY